MAHEIRWNQELQEWFCARCGRTSDHLRKEDAEVEIEVFPCELYQHVIHPYSRRTSHENVQVRTQLICGWSGSLSFPRFPLLRCSRLRVLRLMEIHAGWAEHITAQLTVFSVGIAQFNPTVRTLLAGSFRRDAVSIR
jgi:hypothetical protein